MTESHESSVVPPPVAVTPWYAGVRVARTEIPTALRLVLALGLAGIPVGLVWLVLAPRREFKVVDGGFQALEPESEALIGADGWLMLLTGVLGMLVGVLVWQFVRARGVGTLVGLASGMVMLSVVTWQVGEWVGTGATEQEQAQLGAIVTPPLHLRAIPALLAGAFLATLAYLVLVSFARRDDLQRRSGSSISSDWTALPVAPAGPAPHVVRREPSAPDAADATRRPTAQLSDSRPAVPGDPRP